MPRCIVHTDRYPLPLSHLSPSLPLSLSPQEQLLLDAMFEVPGSDISAVYINEETVLGRCPPAYHYTSQEEGRRNLEAGVSSANS